MGKNDQHPATKYTGIRITHAHPIMGTQKLYVVWETDDEAVVDISEIIKESKWFKPLQFPELFQSVKIEDWGSSLEWSNGADVGSDEIRWMADEQQSIIKKEKIA